MTQGFNDLLTWIDYGGISTVTGWSSTTTKQIYYKRIGKLVFISFLIDGTSNTTTVIFTLPYTSSNDVPYRIPIVGIDNGARLTTLPVAELPANSSTVTCYLDNNDTAWTNTGNKAVWGQFFYEAK